MEDTIQRRKIASAWIPACSLVACFWIPTSGSRIWILSTRTISPISITLPSHLNPVPHPPGRPAVLHLCSLSCASPAHNLLPPPASKLTSHSVSWSSLKSGHKLTARRPSSVMALTSGTSCQRTSGLQRTFMFSSPGSRPSHLAPVIWDGAVLHTWKSCEETTGMSRRTQTKLWSRDESLRMKAADPTLQTRTPARVLGPLHCCGLQECHEHFPPCSEPWVLSSAGLHFKRGAEDFTPITELRPGSKSSATTLT
nr:uncharacterized protein LOC129157059 [Nothobranchius furzeri]